MSTTCYNPPFARENATAPETALEMEAKIRQLVVESRRKKGALGENAKSHLACGVEPSADPVSRQSDTPRSAPTTTSTRDMLMLLAEQQKRLEEEIARAKAQLERAKPKSTGDKRRWPETNLQNLIFEISDNEEDDDPMERTPGQLQIITNRQ